MINSYIKLTIASLLPVALSVVFYVLNKKTVFGTIKNNVKQLIFGVSFGLLAVIGTEWGIPMHGAQVNCRDAAVMVAGLLFGAPAGIIAGLIGGIERWFAVFWGVGQFTRLACTVSTILAGFFAATLRKLLFEDKRPSWGLAFAVGIVIEVFHLTMVFITNINNPQAAIEVVKSCTAPMVTANGLSVMLSAIAITVISKEKIFRKHEQIKLAYTIQRWLLICVIFAFTLTSYFVLSLQNGIAVSQTNSVISNAIDDVIRDLRLADKNKITEIAMRHQVGKTGFLVILDKEGNTLGFSKNYIPLKELDVKSNYIVSRVDADYTVLGVLPNKEAYQSRNIAVYVNTFTEILVFALLFGLIYRLIKKVVVNQLAKINNSLAKIIKGNLNEVVNVRSNAEFASLSDDINTTVSTLKMYIAEAEARIDKELQFANDIQNSALPKVFPHCSEYELYASMNPAKEVGGDFYDFYKTGEKLNVLIADVSGKGIPAAMFMMRAKTELKTLTENNAEISEVFTHSNNALCEGNDAGMFVTAWQCSLDLNTGSVKYVNAGHNPPLVRHANGKFEYLKSRSGLVLAGMEGARYSEQEMTLESGDVVFLYTDGVTEATDKDNRLYGEERLINFLNTCDFSSMKDLCAKLREDIDSFVGDADQFDDITMVAFRFDGKAEEREIVFDDVKIDDINRATEFLEDALSSVDCPSKVTIQLSIALDEIISNIVKYAYRDSSGSMILRTAVNKHSATVTFIDDGKEYNPLIQADPDVTLSAEDRKIGGLGLFMVRKTMSDMSYEYKAGKNILKIRKDF